MGVDAEYGQMVGAEGPEQWVIWFETRRCMPLLHHEALSPHPEEEYRLKFIRKWFRKERGVP